MPKADSADADANGTWVSVVDTVFVTGMPSECMLNVARRAGLNIPDMPKHAIQVIRSLCIALAQPGVLHKGVHALFAVNIPAYQWSDDPKAFLCLLSCISPLVPDMLAP